MSYTLDLSYYQSLIYPIICQYCQEYSLKDNDLLDTIGQLLVWQVALHYPQLLRDEKGLMAYVRESLSHYFISPSLT